MLQVMALLEWGDDRAGDAGGMLYCEPPGAHMPVHSDGASCADLQSAMHCNKCRAHLLQQGIVKPLDQMGMVHISS